MLKRYSEYKDSGIEWIGQVPKDWAIKRLKFVADINPSRLPDMADETQCVFIPMEAMNSDGTFDQSLRRPVSELKTGFTCFSKDDVIFAKITPCFENGKGALLAGLTTDIGFGSTEFHVLRMRKGKTISRFLYYLSVSGAFRRLGKAFMQGVAGQKRVTNDFVCDFVAGVPSLSEQEQIDDFLDRKTEQIDDLIAKKERMIELLKEERAAAINQAVTKGLDSKAEMKDFGIEWLGKIPRHWYLQKLKYISRINSRTLPETTDESYEFNYIDIGNVSIEEGFKISEKIRFDVAPSRARRIVKEGDTILSTVRTYLKAIAYTGEDVKNIIVSTGFAVISPYEKIIPKFLYYALRSEKFIDRVCALSVGVSYPAINSSELSNISIWYPDNKDEQEQIVQFIDHKIAQIDEQVVREEELIELLKEYRTALISEVVTGKIDVRGAVEC